MADPCFGSLQVCRLRAALLDETGAPIPGANNGYVSDSVIEIDVGVELSKGDDLELKNGCGNVCQQYRGCDLLKTLSLSLDLCQLEYELVTMLVGGSAMREVGSGSPGEALGWEFPSSSDDCPNGVSFEFWTKAWDGSSQATPAALGGGVAYHHWVATRGKFQLDSNKFVNDILTFSLTGVGTANPNLPTSGPFGDWPGYIEAGGGITTTGGVFLDTEIPEAGCETIEVPA